MLGVELGLPKPTRDFLEEERGVTLVFRNDLTGVEKSSCEVPLTRGVTEPAALLLRTVRADCEVLPEARLGARRGVTGVFAVRVVASVGLSGRPLVLVFVRSTGMVQGKENVGFIGPGRIV